MPDTITGEGAGRTGSRSLNVLRALERKVLWLAAWTIHNANHIRPNRDGLKVGGHQASSASVVTLMTALYFSVLRPQDRVAVKPHASPVFHAIQYLLGNQTVDRLERFRALGGAQSYPSRTKDADDVDFSTGSVGLGVALTSFASLVQDYVRMKGMTDGAAPPGRMISIVGDAELDEGNVYEALLEGWKHDIRNVWWIIDYNRQSLDSIVADRLFGPIEGIFQSLGWNVVVLKYGKRLEAAFGQPGGTALRDWIDTCPNSLYSALTFKGGAAWREVLHRDLGHDNGAMALIEGLDDAELGSLMTNLAGHDIEAVLDAFDAVTDDRPTCFIAYTIKGFGLPLAGHKDNHAGLMTLDQMAEIRLRHAVPEGREWDPHAGLPVAREIIDDFLENVPFRTRVGRVDSPTIDIPAVLPAPKTTKASTQEAFGKILAEIARGDDLLAQRLVTTSPDVTVSTNLGGWVNRRGLFDRTRKPDTFREQGVASPQKWAADHGGQHVELGIAEHNLFLALAAMGLSHSLFGARLLPIGTLYDPFIKRGLDALNYACYQDARFMVVATPSGVTLAPEGGAHQSIITPLIGMGQPGLTFFEPATIAELAAIMRWSLVHMQEPDGGSVYLRLSTRSIPQPANPPSAEDAIAGAYWARPPQPGTDLAVIYAGAVLPEVLEAIEILQEDIPGIGLLAVTSADRLHAGWLETCRLGSGAMGHLERLMAQLSPDAALVSVVDGHPATLSWIGSATGKRIVPLGVERFGQSGDIPDLYRLNGIDAEGIVDAAATALLSKCL